MEERVEIVRALLEMFKRREHETPFAFYAKDIVWTVEAYTSVGVAGTYEGHDGIRTFWRSWLEAWEDIQWEYEVFSRGDDAVALITNQRNLGRGSGLWVEQEPYELTFSFRGNQVIAINMRMLPGDAPSGSP